jgi:hypothetical protein
MRTGGGVMVSEASRRAVLGLNSPGWEMSRGVMSSRTTTTRRPISVIGNSRWAKACGMRTQPCEAGWPGSTPAWSAMPVQVMRCMNGMLPSSYRLELWSAFFCTTLKMPAGVS